MVVFPHSELVCHTPYLSLCGFLIPLDMNLDGFSGDLNTTVGSLSIDLEFSLIVEELLKRVLYVLDGVCQVTIPFLGLRHPSVPLYVIRLYRWYQFSWTTVQITL